MTALTPPAESLRDLNDEPVSVEIDAGPLRVHGIIPAGLAGTLLRNGPNPVNPAPDAHWFTGDGMLHAFRFHEGGVWYRNRWTRTQELARHQAGAASKGDFVPATPDAESNGTANTHIVWHGGRLMALEEAHLPIEIDPLSLATRGSIDFAGAISGPFTAHPKIDPDTGEMLFFGYGNPERLSAGMTYGTLNASGEATHFEHFTAPFASMVHDFMFTATQVILPVMPLTASQTRAMQGGPAYVWEPGRESRIGIWPRAQGTTEVEWWQGPSCFVFHAMNSWEDNGVVYADVMRFPVAPLFPDIDGNPPCTLDGARLHRWTFDPATPGRTFTEQLLCDIPGEFPRIDDRFASKAYRHCWFAGHRTNDGETEMFSRIVHLDMRTGQQDIYELPAGYLTSEPVFVPRTATAAEGDGWIMVVVYCGLFGLSEVLILDAQELARGPLATIELPVRVPNGFHGNWLPADCYAATADAIWG